LIIDDFFATEDSVFLATPLCCATPGQAEDTEVTENFSCELMGLAVSAFLFFQNEKK
jgi:hypothetical protein